MKSLVRYCVLLSVFVLSACSDDDSVRFGGSLSSGQGCEELEQRSCSVARQNQCVHEVLRSAYLWYREVPAQINYDSFASPAETLDFLRFGAPDGPDRFSHLTSEQSFRALYSQGEFLGFGFSSEIDRSGRVWVRFVFDDSAAGRAGLARGDEIVSVDGQTLTDITSDAGWTSVFGPREDGYQVEMVVTKVGGSSETVTLKKSTVGINTVLHHSVIDNGGVKTGYLILERFLSTSIAELDAVFASFNAASVSRVVLDLRFNGGGSVSVANYLASYLHNSTESTSVFNRLVFNDRFQEYNSSYVLQHLDNQLDLEKLTIITTGQTASASEMMINGLRPLLDVKTVGSRTYGKPVGQNPFFFCGNALLPVTFKVENSVGVGGYFDGIAADCAASDDVSYAFGDSNDPMLSAALHLADSGSCQASRGVVKAAKPRIIWQSDFDEIIGAF